MACKVIVKKSLETLIDRERALNEVKIHRKLLHINIITYEGYVDDFDHIYMFMELFERGTLAQLLSRRKLFHELEV
jgi:serine/threonine protein kinase